MARWILCLCFGVSGGVTYGAQVQILDHWTAFPLEGAWVRVSYIREGIRMGVGQECQTDEQGRCEFEGIQGEAWYRFDVVKAGYTAQTRFAYGLPLQTRLMPLPETQSTVEAQGKLRGFMERASPFGSEWVYAGLVTGPIALDGVDALAVESLISPWKDTLSLFGEREVPSNLVLPEQKVRLPVGSVSLKKDRYRLPRIEGTRTPLFVFFGRIHRDALLSAASGGGVSPALLNELEVMGLGETEHISWSSVQTYDITRSQVLDVHSLRHVPVSVHSTDQNTVLAIGLERYQDEEGRSMARPLDVKQVESTSVGLRFPREPRSNRAFKVAVLEMDAEGTHAEGVLQGVEEEMELPLPLEVRTLPDCDQRMIEVLPSEESNRVRMQWKGKDSGQVLWEVHVDSQELSEALYFETDVLEQLGLPVNQVERVEMQLAHGELSFALRKVRCTL